MNREAERKRLEEMLERVLEDPTLACPRFGKKINCDGCDFDKGYDCNMAGRYANYLLDNGIVVPPVKVGQTVYRIVEMSTGITSKIRAIRKEAKTTGVIHPCEPTIKRFIRCVTVTKNNYIDCCENHGKTVFTSREEAEKALEGSGGLK